ncbi:MAG TPA: S41 family peptidase [Cryomorphaceae bacterium]|nr:S41 family peptidase [Cryomorphaceae bacterium]
MRRTKYILIALVPVLLASCEKALLEEDLASTNRLENFEYLWNECDEKYAYFELKGVDWNQVKTEYQSKIYPGMSEDSLFTILGGMLTELKDDHANLVSNFNTSFYGVQYQAQDNFDWRIIVDHYITTDYYISGPFVHNYIENQEIGYIRFSSFSNSIDPASLDFVLERYQYTKGLILDLRENGGGAIANVFKILSRFVDSETLVYYSRIKAGVEHGNFSEPTGAYVQPYSGIRYGGKVIVLTDRGTYSSGSLLALATKALPQLSLMGDTTGGGLGVPNGGQLPNGWTYRFSITQTLTLDKKPDFENGVPPDVAVQFDWNDLDKDEILDMAIDQLL